MYRNSRSFFLVLRTQIGSDVRWQNFFVTFASNMDIWKHMGPLELTVIFAIFGPIHSQRIPLAIYSFVRLVYKLK